MGIYVGSPGGREGVWLGCWYRAERDGGMVPSTEVDGRGWDREGDWGVAQAGADGEVRVRCDTLSTPCVRYLLLVGLQSWAA